MAIVIGDNLSLNASKPNLDSRWGPYNSVQEAFNALDDREVLCVGLTVGIRDASTGLVNEYWFRNKAEVASDLIMKNEDDRIISMLQSMNQTLTNIDTKVKAQDASIKEQEKAQETDEWLEI